MLLGLLGMLLGMLLGLLLGLMKRNTKPSCSLNTLGEA
jgi:hypothetical protein